MGLSGTPCRQFGNFFKRRRFWIAVEVTDSDDLIVSKNQYLGAIEYCVTNLCIDPLMRDVAKNDTVIDA